MIRDVPVERAGLGRAPAAESVAQESVAQGQRLEGCDGHVLPVDRVEPAERVTKHGEPLGENREPFIATPDAGRKPEPYRVVEGLVGGDAVVDIGRGCDRAKSRNRPCRSAVGRRAPGDPVASGQARLRAPLTDLGAPQQGDV